jgi:hypothetical protein
MGRRARLLVPRGAAACVLDRALGVAEKRVFPAA